jgi:hypothetical protein
MEWSGEREGNRDWLREQRAGDHYLPTISLIHVPHPKIPNLYQRCFEYLEPWQWSPVTELVETGQWFFAKGSHSSLRRGGK